MFSPQVAGLEFSTVNSLLSAVTIMLGWMGVSRMYRMFVLHSVVIEKPKQVPLTIYEVLVFKAGS